MSDIIDQLLIAAHRLFTQSLKEAAIDCGRPDDRASRLFLAKLQDVAADSIGRLQTRLYRRPFPHERLENGGLPLGDNLIVEHLPGDVSLFLDAMQVFTSWACYRLPAACMCRTRLREIRSACLAVILL